MKVSYPHHILVIDEVPLIAIGMQEIFRWLNPSVTVEYSPGIFSALSAKVYEKRSFDLIVLGLQASCYPEDIPQSVADLRTRFGNTRIMLFTDRYDAHLIEKIKEWGIDACVHKYETPEEVRNAWWRLCSGEAYVSTILHTLYYEYHLDLEGPPSPSPDNCNK